MQRWTRTLYLCVLFLLPWSWFPPFPWLHQHAQWSDALFAVTVVSWTVDKWRAGGGFQFGRILARNSDTGFVLRPIHASLALYLLWALLSLCIASPDRQLGSLKLLGMVELCLLAVITSDLVSDPEFLPSVTRVVAVTSLLTALAAGAGFILYHGGVNTGLVGACGDHVVRGHGFARAQAGLYHPGLLASYAIFAFSVISRERGALPPWLRHTVQLCLFGAVVLTVSRGILGLMLAALIGTARTRARRWIAVAAAAAAVVFVVVLTVWNHSFDPSNPLGMSVNLAEPSSRWITLTSALRTFLASPFLGSGLGTSPGYFHGMPFDAHLTPLNIAATLGLPALLAFSVVPVLLWRNRRRPTDLSLWGGMAGLALDSLAIDIEEFRHVWVLFGLTDADRR